MGKTISVTNLRKDLFNNINSVYLTKDTLTVEKGGIPLVIISPASGADYLYKPLRSDDDIKVVRDSQGSWKNDADWDKNQETRDKLDKKALKELKKEW